jgi:hypothetical protein
MFVVRAALMAVAGAGISVLIDYLLFGGSDNLGLSLLIGAIGGLAANSSGTIVRWLAKG